MVRKSFFSFLFVIGIYSAAQAQVRDIPAAVKETFEKQYGTAEQVDYDDLLASVHVHFVQNGEKYTAKYTNKGAWKETEKEASYDTFSQAIKDGFEKSKFADWKVTEAAVIYMPGGAEQYRVKAEKNDVLKRYLYFSTKGRLLRDSITL